MALKLKTPPASEPLTLAETKAYLNVTDTGDDTLITSMLTAVRQKCEEWTGRALVTQTWTLWLDRFSSKEIPGTLHEGHHELPVNHFDGAQTFIKISRPPLQSVSFIKTYDINDAASTFDASKYFQDTVSEPGRIVLNSGSAWPTTKLRPANAVEVEFVAGYGDASSVPEPIKQGMLLWTKLLYADKSWLFESGEPTEGLAEFNRASLPPLVAELWHPYKLNRI